MELFLLLQLDAERLFHRLIERRSDYIMEFSLKRTRDHFNSIFFTRYYAIPASDLQKLSGDLIIALDHFYGSVEELQWYVMHTQDMTTAFTDRIETSLKIITKHYNKLTLHLIAELRAQEDTSQEVTT